MNLELAIELFRGAIMNALMLVTPTLMTAIAVGLMISLIQSITSIQDQTLTFAPKLFAVGIVMVASSSWLMKTLMNFTVETYSRMTQIPF